MTLLQFTFPPLPYYIASDQELMPAGSRHASRRNLGVFDLLFVLRGCLYMGEDEQRYDVSAGHVFILRPDRYHYGSSACQENTTYYWLHFEAGGPWRSLEESHGACTEDGCSEADVFPSTLSAAPFTELLPQFCRVSQPERFAEVLRELTLIGKGLHLQGARLKQQVLFQELIRQLTEPRSSETPSAQVLCAERAAAYLREHYREEVTSKALGESINFHPVYIARCMQKTFGCSPAAYLMRYRIERAKLLLQQTDLSVGRIAEEVGFNQAAYFTSCFVKYEGISPRRYRQQFA